jgi:hypothetical protein
VYFVIQSTLLWHMSSGITKRNERSDERRSLVLL